MNKTLLVLCSALALTACPQPADLDSMDPAERHRAVIEARIAATNARDWDAWQALHVDDAVRTAPDLPEALEGAPAMREAIEHLVETFPDYHLELLDVWSSGDHTFARIHTHATMLGEMALGDTIIPATGRSFEQEWVALVRFEGDKIATFDEFYDTYTILIQLGLAEAP